MNTRAERRGRVRNKKRPASTPRDPAILAGNVRAEYGDQGQRLGPVGRFGRPVRRIKGLIELKQKLNADFEAAGQMEAELRIMDELRKVDQRIARFMRSRNR